MELEDAADDQLHGAGIGLITLNSGVAHGGIAIAYRESMMSMKQVDFPNLDGFEVLVTVATPQAHGRKTVTIAAYIPPNYRVPKGRRCLRYIADSVIEAKQRYNEPTRWLATLINGT